jgi:Lrp/AsnC family transcriptional regulator, leucine-responsive regulatory protein
MKDVREKLIGLLRQGYCTPQITQLARRTKIAPATLHYNIRSLEHDSAIRAYKAVFDHKKIGEGFCVFVLLTLSPDEYGNPEKIARELAAHSNIESVDIITGDWEMLVKVRCADQDAYYDLVKTVISRKGVTKITSLTSLKQVKTEFVVL